MKTPHKHAELIKLWADGAEIQYRKQGEYWVADDEMGWYKDYQYRIKPEPKPDIVEWHNVVRSGCTPTDKPNIKLTFDGETGRLKAVEVTE